MNATIHQATPAKVPASAPVDIVMDCKLDKIFYGDFMAMRDSHVPIEKNMITGFIGPSGCGKNKVLRSLNRMNDLVVGFRFNGQAAHGFSCLPSKFPLAFGIDLHIDDSEGVRMEGEAHGFRVLVVRPDDERWTLRVLDAVAHAQAA